MIYIVSGFMRSGTSMMMKALEAGGMDAVYSRARDVNMNDRFGEADYVPNDSYYELDVDEYRRPDFPAPYDGRLVKCLCGGIERLPVGEYRVVYMRRPADEIRLSMTAFFGRPNAAAMRHHFDEQMKQTADILRDRRSFVSVDEVWYADVIANPLAVFTRLAEIGWPIDPVKSAMVPDGGKVRFAA